MEISPRKSTRTYSCPSPDCSKRFPSKYFLKRHKRCHSKLRNRSPSPAIPPNVLLSNLGQSSFLNSVVESTPLVSTTSEISSSQKTIPSVADAENDSPASLKIPADLKEMGISVDWLLDPIPLRIHDFPITVDHLRKLVQLKSSFDFTWSRVAKWLVALGVDPVEALANLAGNVFSEKLERDRDIFLRKTLTAEWPTKLESDPDDLRSKNTDVADELELQSPVVSSVSTGETVEDIPLPTERVCNTDPETLSKISLPKPIPLHDIPLPCLSTIPLPAEKKNGFLN